MSSLRSIFVKSSWPTLSAEALVLLMVLQWGCSRKDVASQPPPGTNNPDAGKTVQQDDSRGLKKNAKAVVDNLCAGKNDPVLSEFNDKLKQAMPADKLKAGWDAYSKVYGPCKSQGEPATSKSPEGLDTITIKSQREHGIVEIDVVYDGAGKISGLWLRPQKS
jgi:Protein of unknown function (DUF3887)